jgi:V8-like Glu-specific endopeptidase
MKRLVVITFFTPKWMQMFRQVAAMSAFLVFSGCNALVSHSEGTSRASEGITIDDNDSTTVEDSRLNVPEEVYAALDAIGRFEGIACTGTHIGNNLVLTAAHCIIANTPDDCAETSIAWGVRAERSSGLVGRCRRVLAAELSADRDVALFEVDVAPASALLVDVCRAHGPGDRVSLFGYPERRPLEWSGNCMLDKSTSGMLGRSRVAHVCDTSGGSSGAPIIDAESLEVIAVHDGVDEQKNQATLLYLSADMFLEEGWSCKCGITVGS